MKDAFQTFCRQASNNILILATIAFASGIAWGNIDDRAWPGSLSWPAVILLTSAVLFLNRRSQKTGRRVLSIWLLLLLFFLLGAIRVAPFNKPPNSQSHIYNQISERLEATVTGVLLEAPSIRKSETGPLTQLLLEAEELRLPSGEADSRDLKVQGRILLNLRGRLPPGLIPGDLLMARGRLSRIRADSTPGVFNYRKHMADKNIWLTGWLKTPAAIIKVYEPNPSRLPAFFHDIRFLPERIRHRIGMFIGKKLSAPGSGLYKAILIGDRGEIPPDILENFKAAGCMHILAISGLHMGLLAMLSLLVLIWLLKRSTWVILHVPVMKTAALISLLPITGYALIAGFNNPVVRALLMTTAFILSIVFDRQKSLLTNIATAGLAILVWRPTSLYSAGFQLSFAAVTAIAIIYPLLQGLFFDLPAAPPTPSTPTKTGSLPGTRRFLNWLLAGLCISVAATLGTAPLLIYHFNRFSLAGSIGTIIVEPLVCFWSLILGIGASLLEPFLPDLSGYLLQGGSWGVIAAASVCKLLATMPFAELWLATPSPAMITVYYLMLLFAISRRRLAVSGAAICLVLLTVLLLNAHLEKRLNHDTSVTFLDVGQGSSTVLEMPHGKVVLVDGGGPVSEKFNVGERIIAPFLWRQGHSRMEGMVISHPHADHFNGLAFLIDKFRPAKLWINGLHRHENSYDELIERAKAMGVQVIIPVPGIMLESGGAVLECIYAPGIAEHQGTPIGAGPKAYGDPNDLSLVVKLSHRDNRRTRDVSYLFPGDIGLEVEKVLTATGKNIKADILLAPHHGSRGSSSDIFLETVAPRYLIVSAGRFNPFGFPASDLSIRSRRIGIEMLTTSRDGSLTFTTDGKEVSLKRYLTD